MSELVEDNFFITFQQNLLEQTDWQIKQRQILDGMVQRIQRANIQGYNFKIKGYEKCIGKLSLVAHFKFQSLMFDFVVQVEIDMRNKKLQSFATLLKQEEYFLTQTNSKRRLICRKLLKINNQIQSQGLKFIQNMDNGKIILLTTFQESKFIFESKDLIWNKIKIHIKKLFQVYDLYSFQILQILDRQKYKHNVSKIGGQQLRKMKVQQTSYRKLVKQIQVSHINFGFSSKADESSYPAFQKQKKQQNKLRDFIMKIIGQKFQKSKNLYVTDYQTILQINSKQISYEMQHAQASLYCSYLKPPVPRNLSPGQNKFIYNHIEVVKLETINFRQTSFQGGNNKILFSPVSFYYCQSQPISAITRNIQRQQQSVYDTNNTYRQLSSNNEIRQRIQNPILCKLLAVKIPKKSKSPQQIDLKSQNQKNIIKLFKSGVSAYILKYYTSKQSYFQYKNCLLMDYLPTSQPLSNFIEIFKQTISLNSKAFIIVNIANSLRFINDYQIVHMDLNLNNILICKDYLTKLIDFGQAYSNNLKSSYSSNFKRGYTFPFSSPQYFQRAKNFTNQQDIFSLGLIIYKFIFNQYPFFPSKKVQQTYKDSSYLKRIFLAPQRGEAYANGQTIDLLYNIFFRCISPNQQTRCQPSWLTIFFKLIYCHLL